jgi:hypothetical protein
MNMQKIYKCNRLLGFICLEKTSGGSGGHRRAKPEEAGARGSRVKTMPLRVHFGLLLGSRALPLLNVLTVPYKLRRHAH